MKAFIDLGADVNKPEEEDYLKRSTPLHMAAYGGIAADDETQLKIINLLLSKGAGINTKDADGNTPLHDAAYYCRFPNVRLLISSGANVNSTNNEGRTPLDIANERLQKSNNTNNCQLTIDILSKVTRY